MHLIMDLITVYAAFLAPISDSHLYLKHHIISLHVEFMCAVPDNEDDVLSDCGCNTG
jgi:hypothetical protein